MCTLSRFDYYVLAILNGELSNDAQWSSYDGLLDHTIGLAEETMRRVDEKEHIVRFEDYDI